MNRFLWVMSLILAMAAAVGAFAKVRGAQAPAAVVQPIQFNHEKHVLGKPKLACTFCHPGAETEAHAGLPPLERCLSCHMKPQSDSPKERVVRETASKPEPPRFVKVTGNPDFVYFSHRAHVGIAKFQCTRCHGDVSHWTEPPREPNEKLEHMTVCLDCHRHEGGTTRCSACHR